MQEGGGIGTHIASSKETKHMFRFGCLKNSSVFSLCVVAVAVATAGLFVSCNNPFRPDMGEQVVVGDARVYNIMPGTASFIFGQGMIEGRAWAHRELVGIEVRITGEGFAERGIRTPEPDEWTDISAFGGSITRAYVPNAGIEAGWRFILDTLDFGGNGIPLPDGRITVQFRALDNVGPSEVIEVVYNVKNDPSVVNLVFPRLYDSAGDPVPVDYPIPVASGSLIRGDVIDVKGLAPGYPMIQIWPRASGAAPGTTPPPSDHGWVSMFLSSPVSVPTVGDDAARQYYQWRLHQPNEDGDHVPITVNFANFTFRLDDFAVGERRADGVRPAVFSGVGLRSGFYYFRIRTRDTSEDNAHGYFPHTDRGNRVAIWVSENEEPPSLHIDNSDIEHERLGRGPNIWITDTTSRIIARDDAHVVPPRPARDEGPIFRLRVRADHSERVGHATLRWEHRATGGQGTLALDDGEWGHLDREEYGRRRVYFTFTATQGEHGHIFLTHPGQYVLTLEVHAAVGVQGVSTERAFNLFMDGEGPNVEIRPSIRGAWGSPDGDAVRGHGGWINESPVTVNGNVQVSIDRSAAFGILEDEGRQVVKWFLEDAGAANIGDPLAGGGMLANLARFRNNPSHENLEFFWDIGETYRSGWVSAPSIGDAAHEAYRTHNFKFNASRHDGRYLWLYVMAMDGVNNLGFAMQKIRVDERTDYPEITMPSLFADNASGTPIAGPENLRVNVDGDRGLVTDDGMNWAADAARRNILQAGDGIEIVLSDDDGIGWTGIDPNCGAAPADCPCDIRITLADLNGPGRDPVRVPHWEVARSGSPREWMATLSQAVMGRVMGHGSHLRDGFYRLEITVRDGAAYKVEINGETGQARSRSVAFHFAVHTRAPAISEIYPRFDSLVTERVDIGGTVESRFPIPRLWIRFAPFVLHGQDRYPIYIPMDAGGVYAVNGIEFNRSVRHEWDDGAGAYTFEWGISLVGFNPDPIYGEEGDAAEQRNFSVIAFDALAHREDRAHRVQVDASPPTVGLVSFNQLRPRLNGVHRVWGNVHFRINVADTHGIGVADTLSAPVNRPLMDVWWLLLPHADSLTEVPPFEPGMGGRFYFFGEIRRGPLDLGQHPGTGHTLNNVVLDAVFDSGLMQSGRPYSLHVIAYDDAGHRNHSVLVQGIRSDRAGPGVWELDFPTLVDGRLEPVTPPGDPDPIVLGPDHLGNLGIAGVARDADDFHRDRADRYVEIRFSEDGSTWNHGWIEIAEAELDPTGALDFRFPFFSGGAVDSRVPASLHRTHGDVTVFYQVRVTDERSFTGSGAGAVSTLADPLATRNKNPQLGLPLRFGTGYTSYPRHFPAPVESVSRVFPADGGSFMFRFDNTPPEIAFTELFATTATFGNVEGLMAALRGTIREANPHSFQIALGLADPVTMEFGGPGLVQVTPGEPGFYYWNLDRAGDKIAEMWDALPPGTRNVVLTAEDAAGNRTRVNWSFIKDVEGPRVSVTNIGRSIGHRVPGSFGPNSPIPDFPADWPLDWPHGDAWRAWPEPFRILIADWPSDFALLRAGSPAEREAAVRARLYAERERNSTVVTDLSITGDFDDMHGFIFDRQDPAHPFHLTFYYRVNSAAGRGGLPPSDTVGWDSVSVELDDEGRSLSSLAWQIPLGDPLAGLNPRVMEGLNTLDIKVRDNAGNWTELFGLRFVLDTSDPYFVDLGGGDVPGEPNFFEASWSGPGAFAPMPEHRRVFSAGTVYRDGNTSVFELRGRVRDANLRDLTARISSGGTDFVTSRAAADEPGSVDTDAGTVDPPASFEGRLSLEPTGEPGEWEWRLRILERDVYLLREQPLAGDGTRRTVSLVATDTANRRSGTVQWPFFLDGTGPVIGIHNLRPAVAPALPGQQAAPGVRNVHGVGTAITGTARDSTGIRDVTFAAARWNYSGAGAWEWLDDAGVFSLPAAPAYDGWRVATGSPAAGQAPDSVEWEIPGNLFTAEGRYQVVVRATDWSLARASATEGNPSVSGGASYHFFIDVGPPALAWADGDRHFFNNAALLDRGFEFTVADPNTVTYVGAVIRRVGDGFVFDVPAAAVDIDGEPWDTRTVTVRPDMSGVHWVAGQSRQYTLELVVQDSAGNQTYMDHTRTFTRDTAEPVLQVQSVVTRPAQDADLSAGNINIGLAGNVTIRGTTDAGVSPVPPGGVRYALLPGDLSLPGDWDANAAWWNANADAIGWRSERPADGDIRWTAGGIEIMRMEPNPSLVWALDIPSTRGIISHASAFARRHTAVDNVADADNEVARADINFGGEPLPLYGTVYLARLAIEATDESGNTGRRVFNLWIYPEGDRPSVEILSPGPLGYRAVEEARSANLLSGRFTLTGRAVDNEQIHDVFFRVLGANADGTAGAAFDGLAIPRFRVDAYGEWETVPGQTQSPVWVNAGTGGVRDTAADGYTPGWFQASGGRRRDVVWSVPLNACGGLNFPGAGGANPIVIEVVARDATRDPQGEWSPAGAMVSTVGNLSTTHAYVVSGAPEFDSIMMSLTDARGVPRTNLPPSELHIGRQASAVRLTFDVNVPQGRRVSAIRFQATDPVSLGGTGPIIDLIGADGSGLTVGVGQGVDSIAVAGDPGDTTRRVTVSINPVQFADMFAGRARRFPLHVTASDNSSPPLTARAADLYLHIDDSPPFARMEFNPNIAGTSATLGGGASPWPGDADGEDVGRVDSVVVWFERIRGDGERRVPWRNTGGSVPGNAFRDRWVPAVGDHVEDIPGGDGRRGVQLPFIPAGAAAAGGDFAVVIDRNDPRGTSAHHGHQIPMDWAAGGPGQQWGFSFDSTQLPSGPLYMNFVVFDRAGNASHHRRQIVVMNDAPMIRDVQLATDPRGSAALQTLLGNAAPGRASAPAASGDALFNVLRGYHGQASAAPGTFSGEEEDIRRGISPRSRLTTQASLLLSRPEGYRSRGARYDFGDFTVRNGLLGVGIETVVRPGNVPTRTFRVEYVSGVAADAVGARSVVAGNVYMIHDAGPADMDWRALGIPQRVDSGYVFIATGSGASLPPAPASGPDPVASATVRRLGTVPALMPQLQLPVTGDAERDAAVRAEFAFRAAAFGPGGIGDYAHNSPANTPWYDKYALFVVRVFDGPAEDMFGDFTLISVRVNNDDRTPPFAQLYDLNPASQVHNVAAAAARTPDAAPSAHAGIAAAITPTLIDGNQNRTMGGLWRHGLDGNLSRPGNIEPRGIQPAGAGLHGNYAAFRHSLTPAEMGQVPGEPETVNRDAFFGFDTVSGRVILRGYAEDDQRISEVRLIFEELGTGALSQDFPILVSSSVAAGATQTGLLAPAGGAPAAGNVFFTDTIDLFRHRVEWAFVWDTANVPANFVAGNLTVRVQVSNAGAASLANAQIDAADNRAMAAERGGAGLRSDPGMRNFGFPDGMLVHNRIRVNVRPYITGFRRNTSLANTRSRQGRHAFFRGGGASTGTTGNEQDESVVVTGFNLGGTGATNISIPGGTASSAAVAVTAPGPFGPSVSTVAHRFRQFTVPHNARTGDGIVTLNVVLPAGRPGDAAARTHFAVNTGTERQALAANAAHTGANRHRWHIQPWNAERSGVSGSDLWNNITAVHIWQSNDTTGSGDDRGSFPAGRTWQAYGASMSIDPRTGVLHASHNEGGGAAIGQGNNFSGMISTRNDGDGRLLRGGWIDPTMHSSVFVNNTGDPWVVSSFIGRSGGNQHWWGVGGVWVHGPDGRPASLSAGGFAVNSSLYNVASSWYNASSNSAWTASPPATDQFWNPRVVTHGDFTTGGANEHVHVAYFDSSANSIRYRYNRRHQVGTGLANMHAGLRVLGLGGIGTNAAGTASAGTADAAATTQANEVRRLWTNLDGGIDGKDTVAGQGTITLTAGTGGTAETNQGAGARIWLTNALQDTLRTTPNARVVDHANNAGASNVPGATERGRSANAGRFNDIDVTRQGFPVIVYFCEQHGRLRMAVSNSYMPVLGGNWHIVDRVIPDVFPSRPGTPQAGYAGQDLSALAVGTGHYVSVRIDRLGTGDTSVVHIAAHNQNLGVLVYVRGRVTVSGEAWTDANRAQAWQLDEVLVVDSVGTVGRRGRISLDAAGNPWIAYLDTGGLGTSAGMRVAFFNPDFAFAGRPQGALDMFGRDVTGWETMHVPTRFRVVDNQQFPLESQLGMENFPTARTNAAGSARIAATSPRFWGAAVAFMSQDGPFRIAYWVY